MVNDDLWNYLVSRATIPVNVPATTISVQILNRPCILTGWSLRSANANGPMLCEFFDGTSAGGILVGEQSMVPGGLTAAINSDTDVDASSATAASANNVTLPGVAGQTTFITGFEITGNGATAASEITVTVTGILGGTKTYQVPIPLVAAPSSVQLIVEYARPIPASGLNTAIVVNVPSFGAGNTFAAVTAHGFQRNQIQGQSVQDSTVTQTTGVQAVLCRGGLFLRMISGQVQGSVWVRA